MKKVKASSIAEVVIALTIISICFTVTSMVFVRSINSTTKFEDFKMQTEVQNVLLNDLLEGEFNEQSFTDYNLVIDTEDSIRLLDFKGLDDKLIWTQEWITEAK